MQPVFDLFDNEEPPAKQPEAITTTTVRSHTRRLRVSEPVKEKPLSHQIPQQNTHLHPHIRPAKCDMGTAAEPRAKARRTDPETSHAAAASIEPKSMSVTCSHVCNILSSGAKTDEQIWRQYVMVVWPNERATAQSVRSRRAELVALGLVEDSGQRGTTETGRACIVWQIAAKGNENGIPEN